MRLQVPLASLLAAALAGTVAIAVSANAAPVGTGPQLVTSTAPSFDPTAPPEPSPSDECGVEGCATCEGELEPLPSRTPEPASPAGAAVLAPYATTLTAVGDITFTRRPQIRVKTEFGAGLTAFFNNRPIPGEPTVVASCFTTTDRRTGRLTARGYRVTVDFFRGGVPKLNSCTNPAFRAVLADYIGNLPVTITPRAGQWIASISTPEPGGQIKFLPLETFEFTAECVASG
jgi:hypothetical protein